MTKIWPVKWEAKFFRFYEINQFTEKDRMTELWRFWLVKCDCLGEVVLYRTRERLKRDLDHCPECKTPGEIATEAWFEGREK